MVEYARFFPRVGLASARILRQAQDERSYFKTDSWLIAGILALSQTAPAP